VYRTNRSIAGWFVAYDAYARHDYEVAIAQYEIAAAAIPDRYQHDIEVSLTAARERLSEQRRDATMRAALSGMVDSLQVTSQVRRDTTSDGLGFMTSDPSVVDARGVPSGLPPSLEAVIPHTPAGDRVRKGLEAVMTRDWKVALAWFQDARNHDPTDPALARLVDVAQFNIDRQTAPSATPGTTTPVPTTTTPGNSPPDAASGMSGLIDFSTTYEAYLARHPELKSGATQENHPVAPPPPPSGAPPASPQVQSLDWDELWRTILKFLNQPDRPKERRPGAVTSVRG